MDFELLCAGVCVWLEAASSGAFEHVLGKLDIRYDTSILQQIQIEDNIEALQSSFLFP